MIHSKTSSDGKHADLFTTYWLHVDLYCFTTLITETYLKTCRSMYVSDAFNIVQKGGEEIYNVICDLLSTIYSSFFIIVV